MTKQQVNKLYYDSIGLLPFITSGEVIVNEDYVVDWDLAGNQCYLNIAEDMPLPDGENERKNALRQHIDIQDKKNYTPEYDDSEHEDFSDDTDETLF